MRRDGDEVHLTPTEYDLLRALARNRGRLLTHRALLTEVWGPQYADDTQALRTHIANLRRKIEPRRRAALHPHGCPASAIASSADLAGLHDRRRRLSRDLHSIAMTAVRSSRDHYDAGR